MVKTTVFGCLWHEMCLQKHVKLYVKLVSTGVVWVVTTPRGPEEAFQEQVREKLLKEKQEKVGGSEHGVVERKRTFQWTFK